MSIHDDVVNFFEPPKSLKHFYDWSKIASHVAAPLTLVLLIVIPNATTAAQVAVAVVLCLIVSILAYRLLAGWHIYRQTTLTQLEQSLNDPVAAELLTKARRSQSAEFWLLVALLGIALAMVAILMYKPIANVLQRALPDKVVISSHYLSELDAKLLVENHFLEGMKAYLQQQAKNAGEQPQVLVIWTEPLKHPTPKFRFYFNNPMESRSVSGYAFRVLNHDGRLQFEPLSVDYSQKGVVAFNAPPSEAGNRFLFFGRASPPPSEDELPAIEIHVDKGPSK